MKQNRKERTILMIILFICMLLIVATILIVFFVPFNSQKNIPPVQQTENKTKPPVVDFPKRSFNPIINPLEFTSDLTNEYFTMPVGKKLIYEGETEDGFERIEVYVTNRTKTVMGVKTRVIWDRVWLDGSLIEETDDWYAQDEFGNVWYFGEDTKELIDGIVITREGSWEAGVNGALPGIVQPANSKVGEIYRSEYFKDEAEDELEILAFNQHVSVPYGEFRNCLKVKDYTPLEPGVFEHKYSCPDVGFVTLEVGFEDDERVELVSLELNAQPTKTEDVDEIETFNGDEISSEEAEIIALNKVSGVVSEISIDRVNGVNVFVIEVDADYGPHVDVIISRETGEVLFLE